MLKPLFNLKSMENKELRIGNYLMGARGVVVVSEIISENRVRILNNKSSFTVGICLDPIPLNEEWLVNFGFSINENYEHPNFDEYLLEGEFGIGNFNDKYWLVHDLDQSLGSPELKHVHQLQNLYFALTGQELTINE